MLRSTTYHPQTDGQSEVVNCVLQQYLRCFVADYTKQWSSILHWAEYSYPISFHSSLARSPFRAMYGRDPLSILDYVPTTAKTEAVDQMLSNRRELLQRLRHNLSKAQSAMK